MDPNAQRLTGVEVILHERYTPETSDGNDFDIAVVRLPSPLTYNNIVQPICLPSAPVADGTLCVVTGWGKTQSKQLIFSSRFVDVSFNGVVKQATACDGDTKCAGRQLV